MGKHDGGDSTSPKSGSGGKHSDTPVWDKEKSFHVPAPERVARGVGDQQTGGSRD